MAVIRRKFAVGAEVMPAGVHFRVWAPDAHNMQVILENGGQKSFDLNEESGGYWSGLIAEAKAGDRYRFRINEKETLYPDPASRFQPEGPHGPSQIIDPSKFAWTDDAWQGISPNNRVIYEMHIGTFTPEGTYRAAQRELEELAQLGITVIEIMPLAEFDGKFGWGYDGVDFFAPFHHYGTPDDLRAFINEAHRLGLGVIQDVVYNHCGASGCYFAQFSKHYFSATYKGEWGDVFNYDGPQSEAVREFVCACAAYWIEEFHFDGFRLDATQQIFDSSARHIIKDIVVEARKQAGDRQLYIVAENEPQHSDMVRNPEDGGYGLDGIWNDDFHHSALVALKTYKEAYFSDYLGRPQEFISAVKYGFLYQGQWYHWQSQRRGTPTFSVPQTSFIHFLQNHDQVANTGSGKRVDAMSHPGLYRAFTGLLLLGPATPLLFQGQEFGASAPFCYFADHNADLAEKVMQGRTEFLHQFPSLAHSETQNYLLRPDDPTTFTRCKLNFQERETHAPIYQLHKDLLTLRKLDPIFSQAELVGVDGAVLSESAFLLRFFSRSGRDDRILLVNMGRDLPLSPLPEPLLAPHDDCDWDILWSSEHPAYGGHGMVAWRMDGKCMLSGSSAVILHPKTIKTKTAFYRNHQFPSEAV